MANITETTPKAARTFDLTGLTEKQMQFFALATAFIGGNVRPEADLNHLTELFKKNGFDWSALRTALILNGGPWANIYVSDFNFNRR